MPVEPTTTQPATTLQPLADQASPHYVATPELRFVRRAISDPSLVTGNARVARILQQRWVLIGTLWNEMLNSNNSEWRDVPLVEGE